MSTKYKIHDTEGIYYLTCAAVLWVDAFARKEIKEIITGSLQYCIDNKGLSLHAYIIMSNHIHLIVSAEGEGKLSDIIRDFKKFSAREIIKYLKDKNNIESRREWMLKMFSGAARISRGEGAYQVWQHDNHFIELFSNAVIEQKIDYIHNNPVKDGIVSVAEAYVYSSAAQYCGIDNFDMPLKVKMLD